MPDSYPVNWDRTDYGSQLGGQFRQALEARHARQLHDAAVAKAAEQEQYKRQEDAKDRERQAVVDERAKESHDFDVRAAKLKLEEAKHLQKTNDAQLRIKARSVTPMSEAPLVNAGQQLGAPDAGPEMGGPPTSQIQMPDTAPVQMPLSDGGSVAMPAPYKEQVQEEAKKKGLLEAFIKQAGLAPPRPVSVPKGGTVVNPQTGETLYTDTRPDVAKTISPAQESVIINRLTTQWDKAGATDRELQRQARLMGEGMKAAKAGNMPAGSQAVLVTFQKILDPQSVVRESEYARSMEGQSLLGKMEGIQAKLAQGGAGLTVAQLQQYVDLANKMVAGSGAYSKSLKGRLQKTAKRYNIPDEVIFEDSGDQASGDLTFNPQTGKLE